MAICQYRDEKRDWFWYGSGANSLLQGKSYATLDEAKTAAKQYVKGLS